MADAEHLEQGAHAAPRRISQPCMSRRDRLGLGGRGPRRQAIGAQAQPEPFQEIPLVDGSVEAGALPAPATASAEKST